MDGDVYDGFSLGEKGPNVWEQSTLSPAVELHSIGSESGSPKSTTEARSLPCGRGCEFVIDGAASVEEFEGLLALLRTNGFRSVEHRLEKEAAPQVVADARSLWSRTRDVLQAYDERGRRLREALLVQRSEERQGRDTRIQALLRENARLEQELKALKAGGSNGASACHGSSKETARKDPAAEQRLSEATARVKALEAQVRHKEKEADHIRARLEQAVAEDSKRQERERKILSTPLKSRGVSRDNPLLEVTVAAKNRVATLEEENLSLTKQVCQLSFQLDAAQEEARRQAALLDIQGHRPASTGPAVRTAERAQEMSQLQKELCSEREAKEAIHEQLCSEQASNLEQVSSLQHALHEATSQVRELRLYADRLKSEPSEAELRWREEASALQGKLAEARKAWRAVDPKLLMRRDKELYDLGLNQVDIDANLQKAEIIGIAVEACRLLRVGNVAELVSALGKQQETLASLQVMETLAQGVLRIVGDLGGSTEACLAAPDAAINELQRLCARACAKRSPCTSVGTQCAPNSDGPVLAVPTCNIDSSSENELLGGLLQLFHCHSASELPVRAESLIQLCDERMAAARIVEAMQKLLCVGRIEEVLPALRGVLDVSALRRRQASG